MDIKMIDLDKSKEVVVDTQKQTDTPPFSVENQPIQKKRMHFPVIVIFLLVAIAGFYSGAWLKVRSSGETIPPELSGIQAEIPQTGIKIGDIYGSADEKIFKDSATGVLDKGGYKGEGTHKLVRAGGVSQTVYLTSSTIDLDALVGHQVTIWGQTFKGIKVGWLMDVGRAKIEALNAPLPK